MSDWTLTSGTVSVTCNPPEEIRDTIRREQQTTPIFGQSLPIVIDLGVREASITVTNLYMSRSDFENLKAQIQSTGILTLSGTSYWDGDWQVGTFEGTAKAGYVDLMVVTMKLNKGSKIFSNSELQSTWSG